MNIFSYIYLIDCGKPKLIGDNYCDVIFVQKNPKVSCSVMFTSELTQNFVCDKILDYKGLSDSSL